MSASRTPRPARAFTLIEVLVSLAIFAMAAVGLATAYLNVLSSYQAAGRRHDREEDWKLVRAAVLAESEREKVEAGGSVTMPGPRVVRWSAEIEDTAVADLFAVTIRLEADAGPDAKAGAGEARVMLLRPAWSDPAKRDELRAASKARWEELRPR